MSSADNPQALYSAIGQELATTHQATTGKMFAGLYQADMVFKLTGTEHQAALNLEGSKLFDPSGRQRPMKEWVQVSFAHAKVWHRFAEEALGCDETQS